MPSSIVHPCGCPRCRADEPHADRALHQHINLLVSRLNEQQRRWFVALEAERLGRGGESLLAQITGLNRRTIRRGRRELAAGLAERSTEHVRAPGGARPAQEVQDPELLPALETLLAPETAGDPMGRRAKGKRSSLRQLSRRFPRAEHLLILADAGGSNSCRSRVWKAQLQEEKRRKKSMPDLQGGRRQSPA